MGPSRRRCVCHGRVSAAAAARWRRWCLAKCTCERAGRGRCAPASVPRPHLHRERQCVLSAAAAAPRAAAARCIIGRGATERSQDATGELLCTRAASPQVPAGAELQRQGAAATAATTASPASPAAAADPDAAAPAAASVSVTLRCDAAGLWGQLARSPLHGSWVCNGLSRHAHDVSAALEANGLRGKLFSLCTPRPIRPDERHGVRGLRSGLSHSKLIRGQPWDLHLRGLCRRSHLHAPTPRPLGSRAAGW